MKRLVNCCSHLFMLIIVSTFVLQRGFNINLRSFKLPPRLLDNKRIILFASAQKYSAFEERIYIAESFIDQDGKENGREYARFESHKVTPQPEMATGLDQQQQPQQQQQPYVVAHQQVQQQPNGQAYQHVPNQPGDQHHNHYHHQTAYAPIVVISSSGQQQIHDPQDHANNLLFQQQQQQVASDTNPHNYPRDKNLQQPEHQQTISHNREAISQSHHYQQSHQLRQHPQQQHQQQPQQQQFSSENMQQVLMSAHANRPPDNQHYLYSHTQIEWRRESTTGELSETFYLHNYHEQLSPSSYHKQPSAVEEQLTYMRNRKQRQEQHLVNQHNNDPQQKQLISEHLHQQLAYDLQQNQHEQYMYSRHSSDDHDYEAAHQYYYNGHQMLSNSRNPSSCDSIDDSAILILPNQFEQPTCRAASALGNVVDQATAAAQATDSFGAHGSSRNSNVESFPLAPPHYHYESSLMAAIRHYWREVGGLCIISAIFLNWLFVVVKRKIIGSSSGMASVRAEIINDAFQQQQHQQLKQQQQISTASASSTKLLSKDTNSAHDSAFEENISPTSLDDVESSAHTQSSSSRDEKSSASLQTRPRKRGDSPALRQRSSTLKADALCGPTNVPLSQSNSLSNTTTVSNASEYSSRYSSDFESIQRLGRGGFGIVFEARNKIDDCHYAVKRICLPMEIEARERVMREVRALAKLDHAGIVRYYNAWLETPPDDWLKQHDAQLGIVHSRDGMSFPSTDGIYDRGESELQQQTKGGGRKALAESGDNSSDWFGTTNNNKSSLRHRRTNGYNKCSNKFLRNNSSSPSLDIVFEGSGSIRLEAENSTKQTDPNKGQLKLINKKHNKNIGDINSDSEDSEFIQFKSRGNYDDGNVVNDFEDENESSSGDDEVNHLTEPFSSSSSSSSSSSNSGAPGDGRKVPKKKLKDEDLLATTPVAEARKKALCYQRELKQMQNGENNVGSGLHFEKVYLYIQMQLCRKDTLKDWLRTNCDSRDKTTIFDLFYQIVDAVEYVHSQDLIHRDLKINILLTKQSYFKQQSYQQPSNIFFSLDGTLKIGDFGLCRAKTNAGVGSSLDLQEYVAESEVERGFDAVHTEQVGTQLYMSPEQLNGLSYNQKVDIFAMGLILLELLVPFKTQMQRVNVLFKARNNLYSEEFKNHHSKEYELVKSLLSRSPLKRPTATEIKQHELLANAQLSQPVIERIYHRRRTISSNSSTE